MKQKTKWERGDKSRLARMADIPASYLSDIMAGRKICHPTLAVKLEAEARGLGYDIPRAQWCFVDLRTNNPLFKSAA